MKNSIIKIALSIIVILTSFSFQSCQKEVEITPDKAPVVTAPVINNSIIGKWKALFGKTTIEREFKQGSSPNIGTGTNKETTLVSSSIQNILNSTFNWEISNSSVLHFKVVADEFYFIQIIDNGKRMLWFDEAKRTRLIFTFERVD
ncbi:MAG: hypothetical protein U0T69_05590 [Chitinophagales bacterium]